MVRAGDIDMKSIRLKTTQAGMYLFEYHTTVFEEILKLPMDDLPSSNVIRSVFAKTPGISQESRNAFASKIESYDLELAQLGPMPKLPEKNEEVSDVRKKSWLSINVVPLLALGWTVFTFVLYILALHGDLKSKDEIRFLVINSVTNIVMLVIGYYFGSSEGSKKKSDDLNKALEKKGN